MGHKRAHVAGETFIWRNWPRIYVYIDFSSVPGDGYHQGGLNIGFWLTVAQMIVFSVLAILAFGQLARVTKDRRSGAREPMLPSSTDESVG